MNRIENEIIKGINFELTRGKKAFFIGNDNYVKAFYAFCDDRENKIIPSEVKGNIKKIQEWLTNTVKRISKTAAYKKGYEIEKDKPRIINYDSDMNEQYLTTVGYVHLLIESKKGCGILTNE